MLPLRNMTTRGRLTLALGFVALLGIGTFLAYGPQRQGPLPAGKSPEATATPVPAITPSAAPTVTPSPSALPETTFQTSGGLRYANRDLYQKELAQATSMAAATDALAGFFAQYGVALTTTSDPLPSSGTYSTTYTTLSPTDTTDLADVRTYGSWLIDEWSKYPKAWVRLSGTQKVALVKNLADNGQADWGEETPMQVNFYQVTPLGSLSDLGPAGEDYLRRLIHHEVDHGVEFQVRGGIQALDPVWSALNPSGFAYGTVLPNTNHPAPGFVTGYAEYAIGEDKAELSSFLFVGPDRHLLDTWSREDPALAAKAAYYRAFIKSEVPIMDDAYFAAIGP
jgi:hypothetical protein